MAAVGADDGPVRTPWRIAVAGLGSGGWHLVERLRLTTAFTLVAAWDPSAEVRAHASGDGLPLVDNEQELWSARPQGLIAATTAEHSPSLLAMAHASGCKVLLDVAESPAAAVSRLLHDVQTARCEVWLAPMRRWEADSRAASTAVASGRLGRLRSLQWRLSEWSDQPDWRSSDPLVGLSRLLLSLLDQLAGWCDLSLSGVAVRTAPECLGLWLRLDLADGAAVDVDLRRRDLVPIRTGWLIHGDRGGYSGQRLITAAPDGEVIDEPVRSPLLAADPLLDAWSQVLREGLSEHARQRQQRVAAAYQTILAAAAQRLRSG